GRVFGLGVNPEEDKLYISDCIGRKIVVTSLDGSGGRTLITCTGKPQGLVLDLSKSVRSVPLTGGTDTIHDTGSYSSDYFYGIAILQGDHNCPETDNPPIAVSIFVTSFFNHFNHIFTKFFKQVSTGYDNSNVPVEVQCGTYEDRRISPHICLCLSEETLVSMPGEVKNPTQGDNRIGQQIADPWPVGFLETRMGRQVDNPTSTARRVPDSNHRTAGEKVESIHRGTEVRQRHLAEK
ncbi:hypothetical protein NP493_2355g00000, partial [Ridgeia piscesae]